MIGALLIALFISSGPDVVDDVRDAAEQSFQQTYGSLGYEIEIEVLRLTGTLSEGPMRVSWASAKPPRGTAQVRIDDGEESGWALLKLRYFTDVAHLSVDARGGDVISPADVQLIRTDVTAFRGEPLTADLLEALFEGGDVTTSRMLRAGRPLQRSDLSLAAIIDVGSTVLMTYERGGIELRLSCAARDAGAEGDVIRLYSSDTRTTYRARITGAGTAQWIETR
ncbi:MAG: flagellar basal body P-ring formation chaperone FlgA [Bacteroidota bacterium]